MKKNLYVIIIVVCIVMCAGCGKEKTPVEQSPIYTTNATSAPTTVVEQPKPTQTPKVQQVTNVIENERREFVLKCDLPQNAREYLEKLEESQILPFLNGYVIKKVTVDTSGSEVFGYIEYELRYECLRGESKLEFELRASEVTYDLSNRTDNLFYDQIVVNGHEVANGAYGLTGYIQ